MPGDKLCPVINYALLGMFLTRPSFPPLPPPPVNLCCPSCCLRSSVKNQLVLLAWTCFWVLCSVDVPVCQSARSLHLDYCSSIIHLEVERRDSSHFILVFKITLAVSSSFAVPYKFEGNLIQMNKNLFEILVGIVLDLYVDLGEIDIFTMFRRLGQVCFSTYLNLL